MGASLGSARSPAAKGDETTQDSKSVLSSFQFSAPTAAVVGGGVSGVHAAYELARLGFSVTVFEQRPVLASGSTAFSLPFVGLQGASAALLDLSMWKQLAQGVLWRPAACPSLIVSDSLLASLFSPELHLWLKAHRRCLMNREEVVTYGNNLSRLSSQVVHQMRKEHPALGAEPLLPASCLSDSSAAITAATPSSSSVSPHYVDPVSWTRTLAQLCASRYGVQFLTGHRVESLNVKFRNSTEMISSVTFSSRSSESGAMVVDSKGFDVVVLAAGGDTGQISRTSARLPILSVSSIDAVLLDGHGHSNSSSEVSQACAKWFPQSAAAAAVAMLHSASGLFAFRSPMGEVHISGLLSTDVRHRSPDAVSSSDAATNVGSSERRVHKLESRLQRYLRVHTNIDLPVTKATYGLTEYRQGISPDGLPIIDHWGGFFNAFVCAGFGSRSMDLAPGAAAILGGLVQREAHELLAVQRAETEEVHGISNHTLPVPQLAESHRRLQLLFSGNLPGKAPNQSQEEAVDVNPYSTNRFRNLLPLRHSVVEAHYSPFRLLTQAEEHVVRWVEPSVLRVSNFLLECAKGKRVPEFLQTAVFYCLYDPPPPTPEEVTAARQHSEDVQRMIQRYESATEKSETGEAKGEGESWASKSKKRAASMEEEARQYFSR